MPFDFFLSLFSTVSSNNTGQQSPLVLVHIVGSDLVVPSCLLWNTTYGISTAWFSTVPTIRVDDFGKTMISYVSWAIADLVANVVEPFHFIPPDVYLYKYSRSPGSTYRYTPVSPLNPSWYSMYSSTAVHIKQFDLIWGLLSGLCVACNLLVLP